MEFHELPVLQLAAIPIRIDSAPVSIASRSAALRFPLP